MSLHTLETLTFTKDWTDPEAFPSVEPSETQARADLQILHDESKAKINEVIGYLNDELKKISNNEIDTITNS